MECVFLLELCWFKHNIIIKKSSDSHPQSEYFMATEAFMSHKKLISVGFRLCQ